MSKLEATSMTTLAGARIDVSKRSLTSGWGMKRSSLGGLELTQESEVEGARAAATNRRCGTQSTLPAPGV